MAPEKIQKLLFLRLKWPAAEPFPRQVCLNEIGVVYKYVLLLHRNIAYRDSHQIQLFSNANP